MKTTNATQNWGYQNPSFWMALLIALMIIMVGLKFFFIPEQSATDFGISFDSSRDIPFGYIKGIRDIFSGIVLLPLLYFRMKRAVAWVLAMVIIVPVTDFILVWKVSGIQNWTHMLIHGLTVLYIIFTCYLLFGKKK